MLETNEIPDTEGLKGMAKKMYEQCQALIRWAKKNDIRRPSADALLNNQITRYVKHNTTVVINNGFKPVLVLVSGRDIEQYSTAVVGDSITLTVRTKFYPLIYTYSDGEYLITDPDSSLVPGDKVIVYNSNGDVEAKVVYKRGTTIGLTYSGADIIGMRLQETLCNITTV